MSEILRSIQLDTNKFAHLYADDTAVVLSLLPDGTVGKKEPMSKYAFLGLEQERLEATAEPITAEPESTLFHESSSIALAPAGSGEIESKIEGGETDGSSDQSESEEKSEELEG